MRVIKFSAPLERKIYEPKDPFYATFGSLSFLLLLTHFLCFFVFVVSNVMSGGYSLVVVHRLLIVVASLAAGHRLEGTQASVTVACGLNSCSSVEQFH